MFKKGFIIFGLAIFITSCNNQHNLDFDPNEPYAILIPESGTYSRKISTDNKAAQNFFDQGLRLAWGFYFPESIASYQEASRLEPNHPMPYWGMAHAMGPNPNSRYACRWRSSIRAWVCIRCNEL